MAHKPPAVMSGGSAHVHVHAEHEAAARSKALPLSLPLMTSLSNVAAGSSHHKGSRLPTIQPASPNKGAPHASPTSNRPAYFAIPKGHPHATAIVSSASSTTESLSELTPSSSRDSLPHPQGRNGPTTPQKQSRNNRRKTPTKSGGRWSRGGASSDDTATDRKPPTSQPAEHAQSTTRSPHTSSKTRHQPSIATNTPSNHQPRFMATAFGGPSGDSRRGVVSPRPKGREAKNTLCRNVTIYGHCRYENTCPYIHDSLKLNQNENTKKRFNVDSPSFTPLQASTNGSVTPSSRSAAISPKAANAAVFTPKSQRSTVTTPHMHAKEPAIDWHTQDFQEFVPQNFESQQMVDPNVGYDPFSTPTNISSMAGPSHQPPTINPYAQDASATYFQNANAFQNPAYHLYWPVGPQPSGLLAYQRTAHDFFIPDALREELQKKAEIARQVAPNSTLPAIEQFHSLFCLDISPQKNTAPFGYASWIYKAVSSKDGKTYALRRLENFRLTSETAIRSAQPWKRVLNGNVVTIHEAFTTRAFGDSSLILVTDYHPNSKSLADEHFKPAQRFHGRQPTSSHVPEQVLWGYTVQIASALKAIHGSGLAARLITPSKILLTSKNRIRLNACSIMDIVQFDNARPVSELQADDFIQLGRLILCIANNNPTAHLQMQKSIDYITRSYTARLKECVQWLLNPQPSSGSPSSPTSPVPMQKDIDTFLAGIADQFASVFDSELHAQDTLIVNLGRELESSRLVRLLIKLSMINERPELDASQNMPGNAGASSSTVWAETGERYYLKLFRDYVFHQVDQNGHPVTDLAHVLDCLNKLDAGTDEKIPLISRDEQNVLIVSYREVKRALESAFQDL
ncbi:PABP-dependent poly A nuclease 3 [Pyrenophora tritici-repentis]|nr:PABP-dependent poly A nuclease 3 [Pyrenophora tritici-repentis]KAI1581207.1 PABP-dependent poly A nuclease 3 [Pyrenophora tritici-repentis]KAI1602608.1 PABP-dependent poly A nuclease 3 [Pyrenophora tritici-repentis]KAI1671024.1 PAB-dependent poly-specific ribonuclease protein [Pyrenophora tritici-repentis]KAI1684767.1 PAB-dependent poly-specific ribonuclease protein [Pyrenophora tritici-repentis]